MYEYITGKVAAINPAWVVVEANGIGYMLQITLNTYSAISGAQQVKLFTHLAIREDAQVLYGFFDQEERQVFQLLLSVSGVGAGTARMILSSLSTRDTIEAIARANVQMLQRIKGIGAKTAQRIVVDLRDKVGKAASSLPEKSPEMYNRAGDEALSALLVLGFQRAAAEKVIASLLRNDPGMAVDKLIREALRQL
ncbi:MAG TPA: Holliday junction branch migration protein RuvA [Bacteroidales bacterium]|nr:Holliday junction branch migration protein RuvA [Bacteroidales bacterium]